MRRVAGVFKASSVQKLIFQGLYLTKSYRNFINLLLLLVVNISPNFLPRQVQRLLLHRSRRHGHGVPSLCRHLRAEVGNTEQRKARSVKYWVHEKPWLAPGAPASDWLIQENFPGDPPFDQSPCRTPVAIHHFLCTHTFTGLATLPPPKVRYSRNLLTPHCTYPFNVHFNWRKGLKTPILWLLWHSTD